MYDALLQLSLFTAKAIILTALILAILFAFFALIAKGKDRLKGHFCIKSLNKKYADTADMILAETLSKKAWKKHIKERKAEEKAKNTEKNVKNMFILHFNGDIKASAVATLSEEITVILGVASSRDEVVLKLDSPGGMVNGYGLAAAQLMRLRANHIPLTITVDKMAASGGYMMACVANKIIAAPFAIIGSIGVVVQLPNFNRWLKEKHIDFEQQTAGDFKRTISLFGKNTEEGREKLQEEIEDIHGLFKNLIQEFRPQVDIQKVATGEHWLGQQAKTLKLVDVIQTSDDYLFEQSKKAHLYEICYEVKKSWLSRLTASASLAYTKLFSKVDSGIN